MTLQVGARIRTLRKAKKPKMTSIDLGRKADISQSYVIEIESGKKNPSLEVLSRIARALDVSLSEILSGATPPVPTQYRLVPIINRVSCGEWMDVGDMDFPPGFGSDYEVTDSKDNNAFYVIASGDSMIGGRIEEGDYLLVSPNAQFNSGDIVMAKTEDGVMVKRYFRDGERVVLEPLNPSYAPVIVEKRIDLRIYKIVEIKVKL